MDIYDAQLEDPEECYRAPVTKRDNSGHANLKSTPTIESNVKLKINGSNGEFSLKALRPDGGRNVHKNVMLHTYLETTFRELISEILLSNNNISKTCPNKPDIPKWRFHRYRTKRNDAIHRLRNLGESNGQGANPYQRGRLIEEEITDRRGTGCDSGRCKHNLHTLPNKATVNTTIMLDPNCKGGQSGTREQKAHAAERIRKFRERANQNGRVHQGKRSRAIMECPQMSTTLNSGPKFRTGERIS